MKGSKRSCGARTKNIDLPHRVVIGDSAIYDIGELCRELDFKNPLVLAGSNTYKISAKVIEEELSEIYTSKPCIALAERESINISNNQKSAGVSYDEGSCDFAGFEKNNDEHPLTAIQKIGKELFDKLNLSDNYEPDSIDGIIGTGGGYIIDLGKLLAFCKNLPYISVPTSASHDGIASPRVSIRCGKPISIKVHSPVGIVADTDIIKNSPANLISAGCSDAISNYTAVLDWKLARDEKGEYYGDYAASLSEMSAKIVMDNAQSIGGDISVLVEALISSGVAIGIADSSRPCSGSEHAFSHALDIISAERKKEGALHGHQCGVGTIMMSYLHKARWKDVKEALLSVDAPTTACDLGFDEDEIIEAMMRAHAIRDRYTILREGLSRKRAVEVARATGVI